MIETILFLQKFSTPALDRFFLLVSDITGETVLFLLISYFYWCKDKNKGGAVGVALMCSLVVNIFLKYLFEIPRPYVYAAVRQIDTVTGYGYSFPSGHAQLSSTCALLLCLFYRRRAVYAGCAVFVLLTGLSRLYLGVHTLPDIAAGMALGCLIGAACYPLTKQSRLLLPVALGTLLLALTVLYFDRDIDLYKMSGMLCGLIPGGAVEYKYIKNTGVASFKMKILVMGVGMFLVLMAKAGLQIMHADKFVQYMAIGLMITALIPFCIRKLKLFVK